jgi:hypothetical protein
MQAGWADTFGKALASQDEEERARVTGLRRRVCYRIDYSSREQSRRRGAHKGGATRAQQRVEAKRWAA